MDHADAECGLASWCAGPVDPHLVVHVDRSRTHRWCMWTTWHYPGVGNNGWQTAGRSNGRYFDSPDEALAAADRRMGRQDLTPWKVLHLSDAVPEVHSTDSEEA